MYIRDLKINHLRETLGINPNRPLFSFKSDIKNIKVSLLSKGSLVSTMNDVERSGFRFPVELENNTEYQLVVEGDGIKEVLNFETTPVFTAKMITPSVELQSPVFVKEYKSDKEVVKARLHMTALGLYEARINGVKVGDRYLTPGCNDYDGYLRFQTYDVKDLLKENNTIEVLTGNGWYKGRLGLDKPKGKDDKVWGSKFLLACMLEVAYADGSVEVIESDESWKAKDGVTVTSSIYDGEFDDYTLERNEVYDVVYNDKKYNIVPDFGAPVRAHQVLKPELIKTPKNEWVLDFKQNMVGFVRVNKKLPRGVKVTLKHGEVLQDECFYNANLRTAKAQFDFVADGIKDSYEAMFTFFGFRYVLVEGLEEVNPDDFEGVVIYSSLDTVVTCKTSDAKINQLISNAYWGQRGNFVDVPTDCPQRDERLGWTADTQVFVNTACYNMDSYAFYQKYMCDLRYDQVTYYQNDIPMYAPSLKGEGGHGGAVWADAGTIIPWHIYQNYGDKELLEQNYPMISDYVETLIEKDAGQGDLGLIRFGFTFGDWLAQDGICAQSMMGGTDNAFIMSVYYYHSIDIAAKSAKVLGKDEDYNRYNTLKEKIRRAILNEFFTPTGRFALDTQCAYILALHYNLFVDQETIINQFKERIRKDFYKMKTGFTGTPLLIQTMMDYGLVDDAYRILFNEECPGWLYCINLGATTIWERWNSILPDGHISGINMNSLNHYSYGSVCEAIYSRIAGLRNTAPGFKKVEIKPYLNYRLKKMDFTFDSPQGLFEVHWTFDEKTFNLDVVIPYGVEATVILPNGKEQVVTEGSHHFECETERTLVYPFHLGTPNLDIVNTPSALDALRRNLPQAFYMVTGENDEFKASNGYMFTALRKMFGATPEGLEKYEQELKNIKM